MQTMKSHGRPVLSIDLGGTNIRAALVSAEGELLAKKYHPTLADKGPEAVIERIHSAIERILKSMGLSPSQLGGISVASAGAINVREGLVTSSPNLPGWRDVPLREIVEKRHGVPAILVNDANAAAVGEHHCGAGRGMSNLVYITVSTGIGGGIIIDGRLYSGECGAAGEIGHMTIDVNGPECVCGNVGCLEVLASGTAVAREAIRRLCGGESSSLLEMVRGKIENITAKEVSIAARNGDSLAAQVIHQAATYLGVGMVNLVNIFNPGMIIVGGGLSKMGDLLLNPARQVVRERVFPLSAGAVSIVTAQLGDDAGLIGAAILGLQQAQ